MNTGIVAFAFSTTRKGAATPVANTFLRGLVLDAGPLVSVLTQEDMGQLPESRDITLVRNLRDKPPPTLRIARVAVEWSLDRMLDRIEIIAATPHQWRCEHDLRMAFQEHGVSPPEIVVSSLPAERPTGFWFSKDSGIWWTRSLPQWLFRETLIQLMPWWLYSKMAD